MGIWDRINKEDYLKWAQTAEKPCLHKYLAEHLLEILQHENKVYAGTQSQISQQTQHTEQTIENTITMRTT